MFLSYWFYGLCALWVIAVAIGLLRSLNVVKWSWWVATIPLDAAVLLTVFSAVVVWWWAKNFRM